MLRASYRQIKRFLNWLNGTDTPSVADGVRQAENHRRDIESRYGGGPGDTYAA